MRGYRPTALLLALAPLTGCLVTGVLEPSGAARLTVSVHLVSVAHFETIKAGLQSPGVTLKRASMTPKKMATFELECADARKLSTAPSLSQTSIALTDVGHGAQTLAVTISNPAPQEWSPALQRYHGDRLEISIDLPADIIRTNATSTKGRTVAWVWSLDDLPERSRTDLVATFGAPAPGELSPKP